MKIDLFVNESDYLFLQYLYMVRFHFNFDKIVENKLIELIMFLEKRLYSDFDRKYNIDSYNIIDNDIFIRYTLDK